MQRGFTLIELMIAVAIVAILAAVALPSYLGQLRKSARAEAQSFMTEAATRQQQYLVDRRSYASSLANLGATPPADLATKYTFTVAAPNVTPPTFTITGTAQGDQALDTSCTPLVIDQAGNRTPTACW